MIDPLEKNRQIALEMISKHGDPSVMGYVGNKKIPHIVVEVLKPRDIITNLYFDDDDWEYYANTSLVQLNNVFTDSPGEINIVVYEPMWSNLPFSRKDSHRSYNSIDFSTLSYDELVEICKSSGEYLHEDMLTTFYNAKPFYRMNNLTNSTLSKLSKTHAMGYVNSNSIFYKSHPTYGDEDFHLFICIAETDEYAPVCFDVALSQYFNSQKWYTNPYAYEYSVPEDSFPLYFSYNPPNKTYTSQLPPCVLTQYKPYATGNYTSQEIRLKLPNQNNTNISNSAYYRSTNVRTWSQGKSGTDVEFNYVHENYNSNLFFTYATKDDSAFPGFCFVKASSKGNDLIQEGYFFLTET